MQQIWCRVAEKLLVCGDLYQGTIPLCGVAP